MYVKMDAAENVLNDQCEAEILTLIRIMKTVHKKINKDSILYFGKVTDLYYSFNDFKKPNQLVMSLT